MTKELLADFIGYAASAITVLTFLPQVIKTWKEKSAKDVSLMMFIIAIVNEVLWITWGILINNKIVIITNVLMVIMASTMVFLKLKYNKVGN
jgi:MtN3 and saliva related transmembrane protein